MADRSWPLGVFPNIERVDLAWGLGILVLALALRWACAAQYLDHPLGRILWVDEEAYWSWARRIDAGQWLPERPFYQDPLLAYALAGLIHALGTDDPSTLRFALAGLGSLTPVLVFCAGRMGLGRAEGVVAGLAVALYGPLIFTDSLIEKEGLAAFLAALGLALIAWSSARARPSWSAAASGCVWGAVALVRANALLVAPLGALWWWWLSRRKSGARAAPAGWFLAGFALAVAPVTIANACVAQPHAFVLTTWQAGPNFYIGNGPEATGIIVAPEFVAANPAHEADAYALEASRRSGRSLSPAEVSRFWLAEGVKHWRAAPGASMRLLARKIGLLLNDYEVPDSQSFELAKLVAVPALSWGFLSFGWLAPLAALGFVRSLRNPFWWFVVLATLGGLSSTALFFIVGRYRIPWTPGLILLGACGVVDVWRLARSRRWRALILRLLFVALPVAGLAWRPPEVSAEDRWGHAERMLFVAHLEAGQLDPAIDALDDARALGPGPTAHFAELLASGPLRDQFLANVETALRIESTSPRRSEVFLRKARWLRQVPEGRSESRALIEKALEVRPSDTRFCREWGAWWLGEPGDANARQRAGAELDKAARGPSADASAAILLALLHRDQNVLELTAIQKARRSWPRLALARAILDDPEFRRQP